MNALTIKAKSQSILLRLRLIHDYVKRARGTHTEHKIQKKKPKLKFHNLRNNNIYNFNVS